MRHLKAEDVEYAYRPPTLNEHRLLLLGNALVDTHPEKITVLANILWLRHIGAYTLDDFNNILVTDLEAHREKCMRGINDPLAVHAVCTMLTDHWDDMYSERPVRNRPETFR